MNNLEKAINDMYIEILTLLDKNNITEYTFNDSIFYKLNENMDNVYIVSIKYNSQSIDGLDIKYCLNLELSDSSFITFGDIPLYRINSIINCILYELNTINKNNKIINNDIYSNALHIENKDIIITDPCYIIKQYKYPQEKYVYWKDYDLINKNNWDIHNLTIKQLLANNKAYNEYLKIQEKNHQEYLKERKDDWELSEYGNNMEVLGLTTYLTSDTLYGDWSCHTINEDTKQVLGKFCADSGMVGVFILDEILKYNPEFDYHINREWTTTLIKNFTGDIKIEKEHITGIYEFDNDFHKKNEKWEDDIIYVTGKGNINFKTYQSCF